MTFHRIHRDRSGVIEAIMATVGLTVLLVCCGFARWKLGTSQAPSRMTAPAADRQERELPMRLAISSDGSIRVGGDEKKVAIEDLMRAVRAAGAQRKVELSVDLAARGATVEALLHELRRAGVSHCTLLVDLMAAGGDGHDAFNAKDHTVVE